MANYLDVSLCERLTVDQGPLIMLPKRLDEAVVQFYTSQTVRPTAPISRKPGVCFASLGWLVTLTRVEGQVKLDLLHPSNRAEIKLPDGVTYPLGNIRKFVLSSNPASTLDYAVMFQTFSSLAYCRPGLGQGWTKLMFNGHNYFRDLTYYQGNLYVVEQSGKVSVVCDIEDPERAHLSVVAPEIKPDEEKLLLGRMKGIKDLYLEESAGSLLLVLCVFLHHQSETTVGSRVYKVPFSNGESWSDSEVKDLGNRALFLSKSSSSFSIEVSGANSGLCKPNCIYFMNSKTASPYLDLDVGVFNMEDETIDRDFRNAFKHRTKEPREVTELVCNPKIKEPLYGFNRPSALDRRPWFWNISGFSCLFCDLLYFSLRYLSLTRYM